jgi:hypothetical protein
MRRVRQYPGGSLAFFDRQPCLARFDANENKAMPARTPPKSALFTR